MIIKPISGWNGYFITDSGKVLSTRQTKKQREMKPFYAGVGYPAVALRNGESSSNFYVHRLVLTAFVGESPDNARGIHLDGNIRNNSLENLRWKVVSKEPRVRKEAKDLTGMVFSRYTVTGYAGKKGGSRMWHCTCTCGKTKVIRGDCLTSGLAKSCGCLQLDINKETYLERAIKTFHQSYTMVPESGCWIWERSCDRSGYGWFNLERGKTGKAHRASWQIHYGDIPDGLCVLHRCDTPSCVNPQHLFIGTNQDNTMDKVQKNRQAKGEKGGRSILKGTEVLEIRSLYPGSSCAELSRKFNVSHSTVMHIVKERHWKHLL